MPEAPARGSAGTAEVAVVGLTGDHFDTVPPEGRLALERADVVVAGRRLLGLWRAEFGGDRQTQLVEIGPDVDAVCREVRRRAVDGNQRVCVLASGDPGFFGITRALLRAIDRHHLRIVPAPSAVSVAFARLGLPWDDAVVVSAHGRDLVQATGAIRTAGKVAVLTSPDTPPEAVGAALLEAGATVDLAAVCSGLGTRTEEVRELSLAALAGGNFDPLSVVVLVGPGGLPLVGWGPARGARSGPPRADDRRLAWGLPTSAFSHQAGMITKPEVRSVVLGKLDVPATGVLWDVGAGSGSVGIACALLSPGLTVLAVEQRAERAAQAAANAADLGSGVHVVTGSAPGALERLPAPDRVFVGGGGLPVLHAAGRHLRPGGRVVATFAALDRAAAAADLLGNVVQVGVGVGQRLPGGGWRLAARNPVFVVWGPDGAPETGAGTGDPKEDDPKEGEDHGITERSP